MGLAAMKRTYAMHQLPLPALFEMYRHATQYILVNMNAELCGKTEKRTLRLPDGIFIPYDFIVGAES
jgi:hypothetical protein